jgi:hypothetical protein
MIDFVRFGCGFTVSQPGNGVSLSGGLVPPVRELIPSSSIVRRLAYFMQWPADYFDGLRAYPNSDFVTPLSRAAVVRVSRPAQVASGG